MSESARASFMVLAGSSVVACSSLSRSDSVTFKVCKLTSLIEMHILANDDFRGRKCKLCYSHCIQ